MSYNAVFWNGLIFCEIGSFDIEGFTISGKGDGFLTTGNDIRRATGKLPTIIQKSINWCRYLIQLTFNLNDTAEKIIANCLTVLLILSILLYLWIDEGRGLVKVLSWLASAASVTALGMQVFLLDYISPIGIAITALLVSITVLNFRKDKEQNNG